MATGLRARKKVGRCGLVGRKIVSEAGSCMTYDGAMTRGRKESTSKRFSVAGPCGVASAFLDGRLRSYDLMDRRVLRSLRSGASHWGPPHENS